MTGKYSFLTNDAVFGASKAFAAIETLADVRRKAHNDRVISLAIVACVAISGFLLTLAFGA